MSAPYRILVADDDSDLVELLNLELKRHGYEVITATSGPEALQAAQTGRIDLALLDIMMPGVDGYHVAQELTRILGDQCPKIIIITSRDVSREQGLAVMCGALAAMQKPIQMPILLSRIAEILAQK
jgi:DNA-binding response OmpR family regulator